MILTVLWYIIKAFFGLIVFYFIIRACEDIDFAQPKVIVYEDYDSEEDDEEDKEDKVEMPTKTHIYVLSKSSWHRFKRWLLNTLSGTISFIGILLAIYLFIRIINIHF